MKYLGIDYGKKKIGLAISEGEIASPLKVLEVSSLKDALYKMRNVIEKEEIDQVVIGVAESGEAKEITKKFINELSKEIRIDQIDETLSSQEARKKMIDLGVSKTKRMKEDAYSASLILQKYLDSLTIDL